ncbi:hypothetical protein TrRE_jg9568, partial [Triparma retinervis]
MTMSSLQDTLRNTPAYSALRERLVTMINQDQGSNASDENKQSIGNILNSLIGSSSTSKPPPPPPATPINPDSLYLRVSISKGHGFVSHLTSRTGQIQDLQLSLSFKKQRFHSPPVRASMDPSFDSSFLFLLAPRAPADARAWSSFLSADSSSLHVCCTSSPSPSRSSHPSYTSTQREVVGVGRRDWRTSLTGGDGTLELRGGGGMEGGGGTLRVKLDLVQSEADLILPMTTTEIERKVEETKTRDTENARNFYLYAVDWWRQYQEISPSHARRQGVRIFAPDESGVSRCVCSYVSPVRAGRMVDSPRHAARFVSLIPFERRAGVGGRRVDTWQSWHTFLAKCRGDVEDHSTLLCSLLLGFGLNAYVVLGTARDTDGEEETREHSWVAVLPPATEQSKDVTFIESLTGQRYEAKMGSKASTEALPYHSVSAVFNHEAFHALKSTPNTIPNVDFDLSDPKNWRSMDPKAIKVATPAVDEPATLTRKGDGERATDTLERALLKIITQKREDAFGLSSNFDDDLAYLLQPAISAYENERLTGFSVGSDDFHLAVKTAVPDGHCFKGLPLCFSHVDPTKIVAGIEGSKIGADIMRTRGDKIKFALRVKVYEYPENTMAVWIMVRPPPFATGERGGREGKEQGASTG